MIWGGEYEVWLTCWLTAVTGTVWTSCPVNSWGESGGGGGGGTCVSAAPEYNIWMKRSGRRWFLSCGFNRRKTKEEEADWETPLKALFCFQRANTTAGSPTLQSEHSWCAPIHNLNSCCAFVYFVFQGCVCVSSVRLHILRLTLDGQKAWYSQDFKTDIQEFKFSTHQPAARTENPLFVFDLSALINIPLVLYSFWFESWKL